MPKADVKVAGAGHIHNSPTRCGGQLVDSPRPGDRQMIVLRRGLLVQVIPESVQAGDVICARDGRPLRRPKS